MLPHTAKITFDPSKSLHFVHANVDGLRADHDIFDDRLSWALNYALASRVLIFAFSESHLKIDDKIEGSDLHPLYKYIPGNDRIKRRGGTGLLVHNYVDYTELNITLQPTVESTSIMFNMHSHTIIFSTVYLPQSSNTEIPRFLNLLDKILAMPSDLIIITGDFNCRHVSWGDIITNKRGRDLLEGLEARNLFVLHLPGPTRFGHAGQTDSCIDLVITNDPAHFSPVEITTKISDHCAVDCHYIFHRTAGATKKVFDFRRTYEKRGNFLRDHFKSVDWRTIYTTNSLDSLSGLFTSVIQNGWEKHGIFKFVNSLSRPWFTPLNKRYIVETRFWERQIKRCNASPSRSLYLDGKVFTLDDCYARFNEANQCRVQGVGAVESDSRAYIDRQLLSGNFKVMRKIFKSTHRSIPTLKTVDASGARSIEATSPAEKATVFRDSFVHMSQLPSNFPDRPADELNRISDSLNDILFFHRCDGSQIVRLHHPGPTVFDDALYDKVVTACDVADALVTGASRTDYLDFIDPNNNPISVFEVSIIRRSMKKGVGSVGLNNEHLRKLDSPNVDFGFQILANLSWAVAYPYLEWRTCFVRPLYKGKGLERFLKGSYRPISNSHTVGKWMESLIWVRLKHVAGSVIVPYQAGGMAKNGALHQLIRVCDTMQTLILETEPDGSGGDQYAYYIALALADCSKAFDTMDRRLIISKLHKGGVRGRLLEWLAGFFHERWIRVVIDGVASPPAETANGGPQGSVLTLFCWLIYVNDICANFPHDKDDLPDASLLMDDCATWVADGDPVQVIARLNERLREIYQWSIFNGMVFSFSKFNILSMGHNRIPTDLQEKLRFGPGSPPWVKGARFLGAELDPLLSFKSQIRSITKNVKKGMHYLSPFSHFARGSQPTVLNINFRTYIWPRFIFSEPLWIFRIKKPFRYSSDFEWGYKTVFENLERKYVDCGRRILGVAQRTANLAIIVRLGWLPLEYKLALNAIMWCLKTMRDDAGPTLGAFYSSIVNRPDMLSRTATIQPAIDFVSYLNNFSNVNLFDIPTKHVKLKLREAMFTELTQYWRNSNDCKPLHTIHNDWRPRELASRIFSRLTTSCYHNFACGHSKLRARQHHFGLCNSPLCRHGCDTPETAEHVLVHCPSFNKERKLISALCDSLGLQVSSRTFLTDLRLHQSVERLLKVYLDKANT